MKSVVLVTGGAGFIGQALTCKLLSSGFHVRILDNFSPQIHGSNQELGKDIKPYVELIRGDVRDKDIYSSALKDVETIVHLAAETGTGQSMYSLSRYFDVNVQGTATLLEAIQNSNSCNLLKSIVVASSRAVYGEGSYGCPVHGVVFPEPRSFERMSSGYFDLDCPVCGNTVDFVETHESAPFRPLSIYALTKQVQEQAVLMFAKMRGINGFAMRYQNVYGPGQSLKNPYTGILAIFSNLARQALPIDIYEDGLESRDFVYIDDVTEATLKAVMYKNQYVGTLNIGSGEAVNVQTVANEINQYFGNKSKIQITNSFRVGDIRHNKADIKAANALLDYHPSVKFREGLLAFLAWAETQPVEDGIGYQKSFKELDEHGLMLKVQK